MDTAMEALVMCKPHPFNSRNSLLCDNYFPSNSELSFVGGRRGTHHVCFVQASRMNSWLLPISLGGTGLAAVCCLTPFLPWLFSLLGISGMLDYVYRDGVLLPFLAGFLILTGYALWRPKRTK
ncbi:mercury resistance system transport protein MerF [Cognatishimia sp. D5M38]